MLCFKLVNELYLLNKKSFLSGSTPCYVFGVLVFSYSHFFLLSSIGGTNVTAEFVNLIDVRGTVTQATTYNKQQDCNKHIAVLGIRGRKCANNNAVGVSLAGC